MPIKNEYEIIDGVAYVKLSNGKIWVCDAEDLDLFAGRTIGCFRRGYACVWINGKLKKTSRIIMNVQNKNEIVDHISGDTLDDRKQNLRLFTHAANHRNLAKVDSLSGYRGLKFDPRSSKPWYLFPRIGNRIVSLGGYSNTAVPALLFDSIQIEIAKALGIEISERSLNFPEKLSETLKEGDRWLKEILTEKQLARLNQAIENLANRNQDTTTFVYLAMRSDYAFKIGVSRDPMRRVLGIRYGQYCKGFCPQTKLIATITLPDADTAYALENNLHRQFADYRIEGEWFGCSLESIIAAISSLGYKLSYCQD